MDLKETKNLTRSADIKLHTKSERHKSETQGMYDILFTEEERLTETNINGKEPTKEIEKPMFGEVATLDWIKTWRAFEIN